MSTTTIDTRRSSDAVRAAEARWKRRRARLIGYGQWDPWRDAEPVRAHVRELMADNMPILAIASGSGVDPSVFKHLLYGATGYAPARKVRTENAERILAFRPTLDDYPSHTRIRPIGSRRRLQALATLGWPRRYLAHRAGVTGMRFDRVMSGKWVTAETARIIRDVYNELWSRGPREDEVTGWIAERVRERAATEHWAGPLAWEDETIDASTGRPNRGRHGDKGVDMARVIRVLEGEPIELNAWERTAAIEYGARTRGLTFESIAELIDMEIPSVKRSWERVKERARADGEMWPNSPRWTDPALTTPTGLAA